MQFAIPGSEAFVSKPTPPDVILRSLPPSLQVHTVPAETVESLHPLTYEVIRHRLCSITDEMGETLKRMSGSPIVSEANDYDFTINDETGQEVQIGLYNTMLAGAIDLAIYWTMLNRADNPGIEDGDMFLCNDPWVGGGLHQNDAVIFSPIFHDGKLFAWTSAICHEPDLGGVVPGSMPITAMDVFSESIPTPPIKVVRNFVLQRDVADAWVRRSRVPLLIRLDLRAKIGANAVGRKLMLELIKQYDADTVKAVMKRMMDDAERRLRDKLRAAPDGTWQATSYLDQAVVGDRTPHMLTLAMTKHEGHLTFDFTGTDPQAGVINCTYAGSRGGIMLALLPTLAGNIPWAAGGLMRCFDIVAQEGTLNNAGFPAAISKAPIATAWAIGNLAAQCLSEMLNCTIDMKENVQATCCGTWNTAVLAGLDQRGGRQVPFVDVVMESMAGGYGARPSTDGIDTGGLFCIPMGKLPDVEMTELLYPVLMLWRKEEPDSGGPGKQRGGVSASVAMTPHGSSVPMAMVISTSGMATAQNQGLAGGHPGNTGHNVVVQNSDLQRLFQRGEIATDLEGLGGQNDVAQCMAGGLLKPGDVLYLHCQGGGGYGDPLRRDPHAVASDLRNGKVSPRAAKDTYGVVADSEGRVDEAATRKQRSAIHADRERQSKPAPVAFSGRFKARDGGAIDENLALATDPARGSVVVCRHCEQQLSDFNRRLSLASRDSDPVAACANVRVPPSYYVDSEVVFREYFCPSCWTTVKAGLAPKDQVDVVAGMPLIAA
jgi:N-methylhydantoinase B